MKLRYLITSKFVNAFALGILLLDAVLCTQAYGGNQMFSGDAKVSTYATFSLQTFRWVYDDQ